MNRILYADPRVNHRYAWAFLHKVMSFCKKHLAFLAPSETLVLLTEVCKQGFPRRDEVVLQCSGPL